ncbi:MAG: mechanosensitive ion channel domain-containing protein [Clostridiales bacterium]
MNLLDRIKNFFNYVLEKHTEFIFPIITIILLWSLYQIIIFFTHKFITNIQVYHKIKKILSYLFISTCLLLIAIVSFENFNSFSTFLGLFSAGVAIALKDLIVNVAGWIFIIWKRPFSVGDRIEIGNSAGDVIDQRIFQFTLLEIGNWVDGDQSTGRIIHIPNSTVFNKSLSNYSKGFKYIWDEISVVITFESNWQKAKLILQSIANNHTEHLSSEAERKVKEVAKNFMIIYKNLTPRVYTNVKDSGIQLNIRYLCEPRKRRSRTEAIWEDILKDFAKNNDIDLAYPTQRIVINK